MGADLTTIWYGIRYDFVDEAEDVLDTLSGDTHPLVVRARAAQLEAWFGTIDCGERHYLAIGTVLAAVSAELLGPPWTQTAAFTDEQLSTTMRAVRDKLLQAQFSEQPHLHVQFEIDC